MRAVVLTGHGGLDKLEYREDWPTPQPGNGEVLVRVGACGLNNTDINTRTAWYSKSVTEGITDAAGKDGFDTTDAAQGSWGNASVTFPRIQGADVAGVIAAVQLCRLRGARVIAIASPAKAELLGQLGADRVIDRNESDLELAIREAAGGAVDVALDVVGADMFMPLVNALRQGGRYSSSGSIAGPLVEFDLRQLVYKDLQLTGATIVPPGTMRRLVSLIEQDLLKPLLAQSFALRDLAQAQETFMLKKHIGNIVVET